MVKSFKKVILNISKSFGIAKHLASQTKSQHIIYPQTEFDKTITDNYFGTQVPDPYRWLEDVHSPKVKDFINTQNELTDKYLKSPSDESTGGGGGDDNSLKVRKRIKARLTDLWMYCDYNCPFKRGDRYFYLKNGALYTFKVHSLDNPKRTPEVDECIFDPDTIPSSSSLSVSMKEKTNENYGNVLLSVSNDGNTLAYGLSQNGSVWCKIHFMNVDSKQVYPEEILEHVRQDTYLAWMKDDSGLFYGYYNQNDQNFQQEGIFFHRMGTPQTEDKLVVKFEPEWELKPRVSDCGTYLLIYILQDCGGHTMVYFVKIEKLMSSLHSNQKLPPFTILVKDFTADYDYITNIDSQFYFLTTKDAPNGKVVHVDALDRSAINQPSWKCVVPEHKHSVISWVICVNHYYLLLGYIHKAHSVLQLRIRTDGTLIYQFPLPLGTCSGYTGRIEDTQFFFKFTSYLSPCTIFRVNLEKEEILLNSEKYKSSHHEEACCSCSCSSKPKYKFQVPHSPFMDSLPKGFDQDSFEINQVFYYSKDRTTKVSMFLVHKKNLNKNGKNPCLLQGYGGFNASLQPDFNSTYLLFVQHFDGVYAVANIRGGGEYGKKWYEAGIRQNKQHSFDDFQAAAKYLFRTKYTCPQKLIIQGNSNGGLVVAASVNQKPELFAAAIVGFGISDYGNPDDKDDFKNLLKISPLHNVKQPERQKVQYPAMLLITGDNDEVVVPMHSYKMIAQLQSKIGGTLKQKNPLLLRVQRNAGHGEGMPFDSVMDQITDTLIFINKSLNLKFSE